MDDGSLTPLRMKEVRLVVSAPPDTWSWHVALAPGHHDVFPAKPTRPEDRRGEYFQYNNKESDALWSWSTSYRGQDQN